MGGCSGSIVLDIRDCFAGILQIKSNFTPIGVDTTYITPISRLPECIEKTLNVIVVLNLSKHPRRHGVLLCKLLEHDYCVG